MTQVMDRCDGMCIMHAFYCIRQYHKVGQGRSVRSGFLVVGK